MLNNFIIVGRLVNDPAGICTEPGTEAVIFELAVPRPFKNAEGIYETDNIPIIVWEPVKQQLLDYCHKGDLLGVKGRLQMKDNKLQVVGERITYLNNNKEEGEENE
jgi:single-strand DNA-binding protein